jgi:hypothetical protein
MTFKLRKIMGIPVPKRRKPITQTPSASPRKYIDPKIKAVTRKKDGESGCVREFLTQAMN